MFKVHQEKLKETRFKICYILMVSCPCCACGVVGFEHKQKLNLRLGLEVLMNVLFAGSFG
ncbi:hypothetical protein H5410_044926 [Solanum commersonii]|uniref:Uncharacterized protein n=1 Tax=Solanum commersonii TaxID=4109 RepID=A0A9J5XBA9_SOLCO|nr:hypothetical protein H5410_044926 [Solanum commersonii]